MKQILVVSLFLMALTACAAKSAPAQNSATETPESANLVPEVSTTMPDSSGPLSDITPLPPDLAAPTANPPEPTRIGPIPSTDGTAGIEGQVTLGPVCPVVRIDQPCPDAPYQATLTVLTPGGEQVTQFTTDADGKFHLVLAPGDYILHPESGGKPMMSPQAAEQPFSVLAGQYTLLYIQYDSGIR